MVKWSENGFLNYNTLISLFDLLLLVNRNARDFCALILYHVTLNISLICSSNFLMVSLVFSMYSMRQSANNDFYFFFSNLDSFFFFSDCCG